MKLNIIASGQHYDVILHTAKYTNGATAILLDSDEGPFGQLTVNLEGVQLVDNEILVKTWSENSWVRQLLVKYSEIFKDTGRRASTGYVQAEIWIYTPTK